MRATLLRAGFISTLASLAVVAAGSLSRAAEPLQDARLKPLRTLNDAYHPWVPPPTRAAWDAEAQRLREQLLVACGLWPMPEKTPLDPVIHGRIERDGYTVEKVFFASRPGHYVTGSLYRPARSEGKAPGVLCPHGHWPNGRFYDAGEGAAQEQIKIDAEEFLSGARYPLQARMVQLARMGCVVFHYDMVGNADSRAIDHRDGFNDVEAEQWLENKLGLQTWNSIRALDFITSLPDVDPERIGVTGASGGGTQTFMLCALDPRPAVSFPAVMVSTAMQGGCVCENASYLRQDINNIAIAALCAPRPMALSGANDWTIDIETKGLPELKQVYALFDAAADVNAVCYPQFGHNYNQVAREMMFDWFNEHLGLGLDGPVEQTDFEPLTQAEMTVFDAAHPVPADALTAEQLRERMTAEARSQFAALVPESADDLAEYRRVIGTAARVMLGEGVPESVEVPETTRRQVGGCELLEGYCTRPGTSEYVAFTALKPATFNGEAILWIDPRGRSHLLDGDGNPVAEVVKLLEAGYGVAAADLLLTGDAPPPSEARPVNSGFPGYTFGYNRPLVAERVRDVLTMIAAVTSQPAVRKVHLVATGDAGPWGLLTAAVAGDRLASTTADLRGFSFTKVATADDPMLLPGALKYGDIAGLAALAAPQPLTVYGTGDADLAALDAAYQAARGELSLKAGELSAGRVVEELGR